MAREPRRSLRRATGGSLALALVASLVVPSGFAPPDAAAGFPREAVDRILVEGLRFDADAVREWDLGLVPVGGDWSAFGIGGDASNPATLELDDVPWTEPLSLGVNFVRWTDPDRLPVLPGGFEANGMLRGPGALGGPQLNATYLVGTLVMGDDIPFDIPRNLFSQFDLVLDVPGRERWQALDQFPDDTWHNGSLVLSLRLNFDATTFDTYSFSAGDIVTEQHNGFAFVDGNAIVMGIEVDKGTFPEGRLDLRGRLALDVRGPGFPPDGHRVVTAPAVPLGDNGFFPYLGMTRVLSPGYPGMLDFTSATVIEGVDGNLWFGLTPREPWMGMPPSGFFSDFLRVGFAPSGETPASAFGFQTHDGVNETFKEDQGSRVPEAEVPGFVTADGNVVIGTDIPFTAGDGYVYLQSGFLVEESSQFQSRTDQFRVTADDVFSGEPGTFDGSFPVYDLVTGTEIDPPATTTTVPPSTTTTTVPASVGGGDDEVSCGWWCWAIVIVWALVLVVLVFWRLVLVTWWTCWIAWFLVIVAWVPLLLAGLWFWYPAWWWWPLVTWYPIVLGYGLRWAPRQPWWQPVYRFVAPAYVAVLGLATYLVGRPEWWLLFLLYWLPPLVFYCWARGRLMPWWRPFGFPLLVVHGLFVLVWTRWLTPAWFLWFVVVLVAVLGWWFVVGGRQWSALMGQKWTWILGFVLVPIFAFAIALWCSWWCWLALLAFGGWLLVSWRHGFWRPGALDQASPAPDTPF